MSQRSSQPIVTALARGLEILRCFDRPRIELTVSQVARRVGLSQPTTWRLCQTLMDSGFLVRSAGGALRVGAPAVTLGYAAVAGMPPAELAMPYMLEISQATQVTTTLSRRQGPEMISIERAEGAFIRPDQPVGWRAALFDVASGLAVLAALPTHARDAAIAIASGEPGWPSRAARLTTAIEEYRTFGFVSLNHVPGGNYSAVAVPLFEDDMEPSSQWALSCGEVSERWQDADRIAAGNALREARLVLQAAIVALTA